jgi:DNA polymerase III subunit alpha
MSFTQLHIHDLYSHLDGIASPSDYVKKAKEYGHQALATTNHGNMSGVYKTQQECLKAGIKPILGVEAYIAPNLITLVDGKRKRTKDQHIILLAQNKEGYQNLLYLNYISMKDDTHFYYSPRIAIQELFEHSNGVYCGTACIGSPFCQALIHKDEEKANKLFYDFLGVFKDRFYAEIQLNELTGEIEALKEGQKSYNRWLMDIANKNGVPIVLTGDVHYAESGQDKLQTLSIAIRDKATIDKLTFELESKNLYYHNIDDYKKFNKDFGYNYDDKLIDEWYNNSGIISDKINFIIPERKKMILPKISDDDELLLVNKSKEGLSKYFNKPFDECPLEYRKRLAYELSIIIRKGFCNYLLILEDVFDFAKKNDITTSSGRGSACGSLVVFCLGITTIDPIRYDLYFERFISQSRLIDNVYDYFGEGE